MNMRLLGVRTIDELRPEMVDASALNQHIVSVPQDHLFQQTCEYIFSVDVVGADCCHRPTTAGHQAQVVDG